jgi:hypothetical protein
MLLVCSRWAMWWGAWNYGPRLLADASPFLAVLLLPVFEGARRVAAVKVALFGSALLSIAVHALGAFFNDGSWNVQIAGGDPSWSWRASPIAHYSKRALASLSAKDPSPTLAVPRLPDSHVAPLRVAATHEAALPPTRVVSAEPIRLSVRAELGVGVERRGVETGAGVWLQPTADPRGAPRSGMPTKGCDLADVTAEATNPERGPFEVAFSTDKARYRPGELLNARLTFRNSGAARLVRIHVLREAPGGDFAFLDTGRFRPYRSCDPWTTAGIVDFVPAGFSAPEPLPSSAFGWSLRDVPPGDYRLHVVVIEGSGSAPALVGKAHAAFVVAP